MSRMGFTLARVDAIAGGAFVAMAAFLIYEGVKLGPGWGDSGPDPGFFPFVLAVLMGIGGAVACFQAINNVSRTAFFEDPEEVAELSRVGLPIIAAIAAVPWLGLYLMTAVYTWLFSWWHGQFRWYGGLIAGVIFGALCFLLLNVGFRLSMPQSIWYPILPF